MKPEEMLEVLKTAAKLKTTMRHCFLEGDRQESVAEHSWRMALMAMVLSGAEEFRSADMNKVIRMCLIHDMGEIFTGDIPTFRKTETDRKIEEDLLEEWTAALPEPLRTEWTELFREMEQMETVEAKAWKALDKLEALISHNESDIRTWLPLEYDLQLTYGQDYMEFSPFMKELRGVVDAWSERKIAEEGERSGDHDTDRGR